MDELEQAMHALEGGAEYPYDSDGSKDPAPAIDWAHAAARGIIYDLSDRRGIKHAFSDVDDDVRVEIVQSIAAIIRAATSTGKKEGE